MDRKYEVVSYTSVSKNDAEQWYIEALNYTCKFIRLDDTSAPRDVCQFLKKEGILESANMRTLVVSDLDKDIILVSFKKDSKPICRLERRR